MSDEVFFSHRGAPKSGRVLSKGRHGVTVRDGEGAVHKLKHDHVLGYKVRADRGYRVVEGGSDGSIVEDRSGARAYVHGLSGDEARIASQAKKQEPDGWGLLNKAMVLFVKAEGSIKGRPGLHLEERTDRTGRHGKHWVRQDQPGGQAKPHAPEESAGAGQGFGTHNIQPGDRLHFESGSLKGHGAVTAAGQDGATVQDSDGREHKVYWHEVRGHEPADKGKGQDSGPNVLGKQEPIPADQFTAADYANSHDQADVTPEAILKAFPPDAAEKIATAQDRLKSIEQTISQFQQDGKWQKERENLHANILYHGVTVNRNSKEEKIPGLLSEERVKASIPSDGAAPTFIILGGRGGSGKSSFNGAVYDDEHYIVLDADHIKGMLPEYEGWNAAQVHEESGELFDRAVAEARAMGLNVVLDKTMKTAKSALADVQAFKDAGYRTEAHYMHLPRQEAAKRAVGRFIDGGKSGRYVPPEVVLGNTGNEAAFDQVKGLVDAWSFRDNNVAKGQTPILISQSGEPAHAQRQQSAPDGGTERQEPMRKAQGGATILVWR